MFLLTVNTSSMSCWQKSTLYLIPCFILMLNLGGRSVFAQSTTTIVSCQPAAASISIGESTELTLNIENVVNFYGYKLTLAYDPALIEIHDGDTVREGVNTQLGDFVKQDLVELNEIVYSGELLLNVKQVAPAAALSGSGELATVLLQGNANGIARFWLSDVFLYDVNGTEIAYETRNCSLEIAGQPIPTPTTTATPTATPTEIPATTTPTSTPSATPSATVTILSATATAIPLATATATDVPIQETATFAPTAALTSEPTFTAPSTVVPVATPVDGPTATAIITTPLLATPPATLADSFVPEATATPSPTAPVTPTPMPLMANDVETHASPIVIPGQPGTNQPSPPRKAGQHYLTIVLLWLLAISAISLALMLLMVYGLLARVQTPQRNVVAPANRRLRRSTMYRRSIHQQIR